MGLSIVEIFALTAMGFISGLAVTFGYALQAIRRLFVAQWTRRHEIAWTIATVTTMTFGTMAPVFIMAIVIFGDEPDGPMFWPRMLCFVAGVMIGLAFSFCAAFLLERGLKIHHSSREA